ncbi:MAG: VWA domain-containing protein [Planctomycetaceae bacterium]|nr:VWA domain-containing protein [Planctomycetaceae bacterium]
MSNDTPQTAPHGPTGGWLGGHALLGSLMVHGMLLGVMGLVVLPGATPPHPVLIVSGVADERIPKVDLTVDVPEMPDDAQLGAAAQSHTLPIGSMRSDLTEVVPQSNGDLQPVATASVPASDWNQVVGAAQPFNGDAVEGTSGLGTGAGSSQFFGLPPIGDKTVFVVDASRSMHHPHPGPARTRFKRVKLELVRTIGQMQPEQQFFLIFFNDQAVPMPASQMVSATPGARQMYLNWMVGVDADGKTNPVQALLIAMQLKPDTIYLLTDGDIPYKVAQVVREANVHHTSIHTIGFGDDAGEQVLREIAEQSGGTYRYISEEESAQSTPQ